MCPKKQKKLSKKRRDGSNKDTNNEIINYKCITTPTFHKKVKNLILYNTKKEKRPINPLNKIGVPS